MSKDGPWTPEDSKTLATMLVVVVAVAGVIAFLVWLNHFIGAIGF